MALAARVGAFGAFCVVRVTLIARTTSYATHYTQGCVILNDSCIVRNFGDEGGKRVYEDSGHLLSLAKCR